MWKSVAIETVRNSHSSQSAIIHKIVMIAVLGLIFQNCSVVVIWGILELAKFLKFLTSCPVLVKQTL